MLIRTPSPGRKRASSCVSSPPQQDNLCTPDQSTLNMTTPPGRPLGVEMALARRAEINAAVRQGSEEKLLLMSHTVYFIHEIVECRQLDALKLWLSKGRKEVDRHRCGLRPLHLAIQACFGLGTSASQCADVGYQMAALLLQHGAQPNVCSGDEADSSPLFMATKRGTSELAAILIDHGADPNAHNDSGHTALHMAAQLPPFHLHNQVPDVVHVLLKKGACPLQRDAVGATPLFYAWEPDLRAIFMRAERWQSLSAIPALNKWTASKDAHCGGTGSHVLCTAPWLLPEVFEAIAAFL